MVVIAMDNIVVGISRLNFNQQFCEIKNENCVSDFDKDFLVEMSSVEENEFRLTQNDDQKENNHISSTLVLTESDWEEKYNSDDNSNQNHHLHKSSLFSERRKMPSRASKESSLSGIKRRTIMKPSKRSQILHRDFNSLKPADIKKIYLNKKLTNFKPSSLETIFEEESCGESGDQNFSRIMGARKIKRSITLSDGQRYTKSSVNKRRIKIKKTFGRRFALKKISLEEFIAKLNNSIEENEESMNENTPIEIDESKNFNEEANQTQQCPDKFILTNESCSTIITSSASTPVVLCCDSSL